MSTSTGLKEHSVQFSYSRGATAGKGRGTRVWGGSGKREEVLKGPRPLALLERAGEWGRGKGATIAGNSSTALELATVLVWGG